jgi:cytochrome c oxidase cbb3-type subunit 3
MSHAACTGLMVLLVVALAGCEREARSFTSPASNSTPAASAPRQSGNQPAAPLGGGVQQAAAADVSPYDQNAFGVAQGKRLFRWYNCSGCHASGGGGIGPALMDAEWRYGSRPADIYASIVQGRPQGMPSFGGHIPEDQVWQIVAYVRSMSGMLAKDVAPSRSDSLYAGPPENARPRREQRGEPTQPEFPAGGPQR